MKRVCVFCGSNPGRRPQYAEAARALRGELSEDPDLVVVFASPHHASGFGVLPDLVGAAFPGALVLGCSGAGIIGDGREIEQKTALSLTAAHLPGVALTPPEPGEPVDSARPPPAARRPTPESGS